MAGLLMRLPLIWHHIFSVSARPVGSAVDFPLAGSLQVWKLPLLLGGLLGLQAHLRGRPPRQPPDLLIPFPCPIQLTLLFFLHQHCCVGDAARGQSQLHQQPLRARMTHFKHLLALVNAHIHSTSWPCFLPHRAVSYRAKATRCIS